MDRRLRQGKRFLFRMIGTVEPLLVTWLWLTNDKCRRGGAIAFRLAGETSGLVDEVVVLNSTYV